MSLKRSTMRCSMDELRSYWQSGTQWSRAAAGEPSGSDRSELKIRARMVDVLNRRTLYSGIW